MRRSDRYTIPFPDVQIPSSAVYREAFSRFPVWYRWYIRLRALLSASSVETVTRRHHVHQLRRTLASRSKQLIDPAVPALLTGFHDHIRVLIREMQAIGPSLDEATGSARGSFLKVALADRDTRLNGVLERATHLTDSERDDPERTLADVRASVQQALRSLNVLARIDMDTLLPVDGARREETPLRVVEHTLVNLYQATELCYRNTAVEATELAVAFARPRIRSSPRSARGIWIAIDAFLTEVPLRDIIRFSREEPFLTVPTIELKTDWWPPFARTWIDAAVERCAGELLEHRHRHILDTLGNTFKVDHEPPVWIPSTLQPRTLGVLLLLAGSDLFQDTRRVITQLVIDATFYHLDTRNTLHQMALQLDQALERLVQTLGSGDSRGTLGEEVQRLQQRSGPSSIVHRQLTTVYERHRPRLRTAIEECVEALRTAGAIIGRTIDGRERAFELTDFHGPTFTSDLPPRELLQIVATTWLSLGRMVHGLYMLETTMSSQGGGRQRGKNT